MSTNRKYSDSITDKKQFNLQFRRIVKDHAYVVPGKNSARFKLSDTLKSKMVRNMQKGEPVDLARKHAMMTKTSKKKPMTKNKVVKASKMGKKGQEKLTKMKK